MSVKCMVISGNEKPIVNKLNGKINVALHQAQLSGDGGALSKSQCSTPPDG